MHTQQGLERLVVAARASWRNQSRQLGVAAPLSKTPMEIGSSYHSEVGLSSEVESLC